MARVAPWMIGVKEREREQAKAEKARTVYGVFKYDGGPGYHGDGGYVSRRGTKTDDGGYSWSSPYNTQTPVVVSKSDKLAQKHADKLNGR